MRQPPVAASGDAERADHRRVTPPLRAAAGCAWSLAVLEAALVVGQSSPTPYVSVLLGVAATATAAVGVALARGGCAVSRMAAGVLAGAVVVVVLLLLTVGRPGGHPMPVGPPAVLALGLAVALLALVATDAAQRRRDVATGAKRSETDNWGHADSRAARGGRPGHRAHPRHRTGT